MRFFLNKIRTIKSALIFFLFSAFSCSYSQSDYAYVIPEKLDDGWNVSSLSAEGIATDKIVKLTNQIRNNRFQGIRSLLIVKNGALVHEAYFNGFDRESMYRIYSITKSVSSTLIGIAIDKKLIENVRVPVLDLLPQYADAAKDRRKREIQLLHLLTLSSGLEWDENSYFIQLDRNAVNK